MKRGIGLMKPLGFKGNLRVLLGFVGNLLENGPEDNKVS
jgi:hypothetical protein